MASFSTTAPGNFPLRRRTGTAAFHLSKEAVDFGSEDLEKLKPLDAVKFLAKILWGSTKEMPCTHCGTIDEHYFSIKEMRWKCTCCGKRFSVTSGTVFADRKLSLVKILKIVYAWSNGASGKPALELRRDWNVSYPTIYTIIHKLREGLLRGHNTGILCGVQEVDGMDVNGRGYKEKRNKPQGGAKKEEKPKLSERVKKKKDGEAAAADLPPKWGKSEKQHPDRRILLVIRQRGPSKGKGAVSTRIAVAITESSKTVVPMATGFASAESVIMSDEDTSYASFNKLFAGHQTVSHSKAFSLPDGTNNNQAESFNWRMKRGLRGIYLSASNKYLKDYAGEQAWREDTRRLSTSRRLAHLLHVALGVGRSLWWRNYTHGHHRKEEFLLEGDRPTRGRGKEVGARGKIPR